MAYSHPRQLCRNSMASMNMSEESKRCILRVNRRHCPHCDGYISLKTYKAHRRRYYDSESDTWHKIQFPDDLDDGLDDVDSPPMSESDNYCLRFSDQEEESDDWPGVVSNDEESVNSEYEEEVWSDEETEFHEQDVTTEEEEPSNTDTNFTIEQNTTASHLFQWLIAFLLALHAHYHLSEKALGLFLTFFRVFMSILGRFCCLCASIAGKIPSSLPRLWKEYGKRIKAVRRYVVCKKCHSIYFLNECTELVGTVRMSKKCCHQPYANHPHSHMRGRCGATLLKTVELVSGQKIFYPFLMYCYLGLECSLQPLLESKEFVNSCEYWKTRNAPSDVYKDVYDGKVWSDFLHYNGAAFLSAPLTYGLMMNIDWFQPYKHITYSVGVIYLVAMNLPRSLRFKVENVMLVSIIPGPHEPSQDINSFLAPLVEELKQYLEGREMNVAGFNCSKKVRCALLSVACDLPAGRKTCGFLSYTAHLGCSRCLKRFTGSVGEMDYSGFDRENWPTRSGTDHKTKAESLLRCTTKTELRQSESRTGCRYTVLLQLPYFDAPRMLIIDPMHNLFLGSAKHYIKSIWLHQNIINTSHFGLIQARVDSIVVPSDIGRIPHKIMSGFASLTADQLKNWVVYYSIIALREILTSDNLECWRHFVLACRILCSHQIKKEQILLADALLLKFCKRTQRLYGPNSITPNMHMHCHIRQCLLDYGPLHGFWLFAFERYNGLLGEYPHNNRSIELQLMNRFIKDRSSTCVPLPEEFKEELRALIPQSKKSVGSLLESTSTVPDIIPSLNWSFPSTSSIHSIDLPSHFSRGVFRPHEIDTLRKLYSKLYSVSCADIDIPGACFRKYASLKLNQKQLGSYKSRSSHSSLVMAHWSPQFFEVPSTSTSEFNSIERPARINYFASHSVCVQGSIHDMVLFSASWFKPHSCKYKYGKPVTVWECDLFELHGLYSILPVHFIRSRTVSSVDKVNDINASALLVCPCIDF